MSLVSGQRKNLIEGHTRLISLQSAVEPPLAHRRVH